MNQLNVGDKLACQIADGAPAQFDSVLAAYLVPDLLILMAFQEPRQAHPNQHIVSMIGPGGDDPSELFATGRGELSMSRTVPLPFDGQEGPIANRVHRATASQADVQRSATPGASLLLPGKDESRHAVHLRLAEQGVLLALLFQDLVDG